MQQHFLLATIVSVVAVGIVYFRRLQKRKVPTKWKAVGKVKYLCVYPIKSGHRVECETVMCTEWGPRMIQDDVYQFYDRNLIVFKAISNKNITGDVCPALSLINVEACSKEEFVLKAPGMSDMVVKIPSEDNTEAGEVRVFKDARIFMLDCGDEAARWISKYIYDEDFGLRLGFHNASRRRNIYDNSYLKQYCDTFPILTNAATGLYAYLCSYSLINQSSVNELKKRIDDETENITPHNFRGNIVVEDFEGCAYVEDRWRWVKIGDAVFYVVKPNTRCCITNIDADAGTRSKSYEPMRTLKSYRQLKTMMNVEMEGGDPVMGCYMGLHNSGKISVEDIVYINDE